MRLYAGRFPHYQGRMQNEALLTDIAAFCETHGLTEAKFGVLAVKDWKLVRDLRGEGRRAPRRIWPETERAIRSFMATYRPDREERSSAEAA